MEEDHIFASCFADGSVKLYKERDLDDSTSP